MPLSGLAHKNLPYVIIQFLFSHLLAKFCFFHITFFSTFFLTVSLLWHPRTTWNIVWEPQYLVPEFWRVRVVRMWTVRDTACFSLFGTSQKVNRVSSITKDFSPIFNEICCINSFPMLRFGLWGIPVFYLEFHTNVQEWDRHFFSWYCLILVILAS